MMTVPFPASLFKPVDLFIPAVPEILINILEGTDPRYIFIQDPLGANACTGTFS